MVNAGQPMRSQVKSATGEICPNGGAALLCQPGDLLIIIAYEYCDRAQVMQNGHQAKVIVADKQNAVAKFIEQKLIKSDRGLEFQAQEF